MSNDRTAQSNVPAMSSNVGRARELIRRLRNLRDKSEVACGLGQRHELNSRDHLVALSGDAIKRGNFVGGRV